MKHLPALFAFSVFLLAGRSADAQVVYRTSNKQEAGKIVFVEDDESQADLVVYKTAWKSDSRGNKGIWYETEWRSEAELIIYVTEFKSEADFSIYFTPYEEDAGWRTNPR